MKTKLRYSKSRLFNIYIFYNSPFFTNETDNIVKTNKNVVASTKHAKYKNRYLKILKIIKQVRLGNRLSLIDHQNRTRACI